MKKRKIKLILIILSILFWGCRKKQQDDISFFLNMSSKYEEFDPDTIRSKLFKDVGFLHRKYEKDRMFSRVGNAHISYKNTIYQLFLLEYQKGKVPGYWGERNDSLLFVPYCLRNCPTEFLILNWGRNGYYDLNLDSDCLDELPNHIGDGYSFKTDTIIGDFTKIYQFVSPKQIINITEADYIKGSKLLKIELHKSKGILDFQYEFDLDSQPIIPWVSKLVKIDSE